MARKHSAIDVQRVIQWCIVIGVLGLAGFAATKSIMHELRPRQMVSIGSTIFRVDVADTPGAREKGLSGRTSLSNNEAMLFVFDSDGDLPIWMKGMKIPIDIIWLDSSKKVVHLEQNVQPDAFPYTTYKSPVPARYVLEMTAGQARRSGVAVGKVATFDIAREGLSK